MAKSTAPEGTTPLHSSLHLSLLSSTDRAGSSGVDFEPHHGNHHSKQVGRTHGSSYHTWTAQGYLYRQPSHWAVCYRLINERTRPHMDYPIGSRWLRCLSRATPPTMQWNRNNGFMCTGRHCDGCIAIDQPDFDRIRGPRLLTTNIHTY